MNEFERRMLEVARNHNDLVDLAKAAGVGALVEHYGYTVAFGGAAAPLLSGVAHTVLKTMQADAWFVLQYVSSCVVRPSSKQWATDAGNINLQITDTGSGDILFSQPLSAGVLTATVSRGQSGVPMLLPIPRILPPNTNVKVEATQLGAVDEPLYFFLFLGGSRIAAA